MNNIDLKNLNTQEFAMQEAFKALRTNISFCGDDVKAIAVTSTFPGEGKTEIALRLAYAFAETGAKTILLDSDIRNSTLAGKFGADGSASGLSLILAGKSSDVVPAVAKTSKENLDILFAGPAAPNPAELLGKEKFRNLLEVLKRKYDYVVVDCPPLMPVIDAAIVANVCDGTLLVISQNTVKKSDAKKSLEQLRLGDARVLGAILNKVNIQGQGYGKYGKYGYGPEVEANE